MSSQNQTRKKSEQIEVYSSNISVQGFMVATEKN